jgi:hypothetical protein
MWPRRPTLRRHWQRAMPAPPPARPMRRSVPRTRRSKPPIPSGAQWTHWALRWVCPPALTLRPAVIVARRKGCWQLLRFLLAEVLSRNRDSGRDASLHRRDGCPAVSLCRVGTLNPNTAPLKWQMSPRRVTPSRRKMRNPIAAGPRGMLGCPADGFAPRMSLSLEHPRAA